MVSWGTRLPRLTKWCTYKNCTIGQEGGGWNLTLVSAKHFKMGTVLENTNYKLNNIENCCSQHVKASKVWLAIISDPANSVYYKQQGKQNTRIYL